MKPILTAAQMREADRHTIEDLGIPGFTLMETAGRATAREIAAHFGPPEDLSVCCLCGKGNNAGDALVVARLLADAGADVVVQMVAGVDDLSPDAQSNLKLLEAIRDEDPLTSIQIEEGVDFQDRGFDLAVDGLLGTGLSSPLREPFEGVVNSLNHSGIPVVAIDVPTGLNSDTGEVMGVSVIADLTVTMGALKQGLVILDGPDYSGEIVVVEIGIPRYALEGEKSDSPTRTWMPDREDVSFLIPRRPRRSHKYSAGMVLAVAGSPGLTGAPALASMAAARIGAGAVVCACPDSVQPVLAAKMDEVMTISLPTSDSGINGPESMPLLEHRMSQASAILIGCGLGRGTATAAFVRQLLTTTDLPAIIDADGLFALDSDFLQRHGNAEWILTPHLGEFRRLVGDADFGTSVEAARTFAQKWNSTLILKGSPSVVGCPDGTVF
ncbi:MAG: NAD(P)H-hydrate epimerase, partial [Rhodothermales bacterium]|nr:NAD(P)H-hydrate epimerase [Rhodothermales bacterium]